MGRRTVLEGFEHMAELLFHLGLAHSHALEHSHLLIAAVDADAATADLPTVEDDIIGFGLDIRRALFKDTPVLVAGAGEGMVNSRPAIFLAIVFKQGEVYHPAEGK